MERPSSPSTQWEQISSRFALSPRSLMTQRRPSPETLEADIVRPRRGDRTSLSYQSDDLVPILDQRQRSGSIFEPRGSEAGGSHSINLLKFVFIAFFLTCGGPFGLESVVATGGVFLSIVGLLTLPFLWAVPQALMTAELAGMFPVNGGNIVWATQAFGDMTGFINAYNSILSCVLDMCIYPVLFAGYVRSMKPSWPAYPLRVVPIIIAAIVNAFGVDVVGTYSIALAFAVLSPFLVEMFMVKTPPASVWFLPPPKWQLGVFTSDVLWSYSGWDSIANYAGEVKDAGRTIPIGIALALLLSTCTYIIPIVISYSLMPDPSKWTENGFTKAATLVSPILAGVLTCSASLSNFGQLNTGLTSTSWLLWAMGQEESGSSRVAPAFFSIRWRGRETPIVAIASLAATVIALVGIMDFNYLLELSTFIRCICLMLEFASFMALKYNRPDALRPYVVPGGLRGAWAITLVKVVIVAATVVSLMADNPSVIAIGCAYQLLILGGYAIRQYFRAKSDQVSQSPSFDDESDFIHATELSAVR